MVRDRVPVSDTPIRVGRALDNELILEDPYADGVHARIARDAVGRVVIEDLGSLNGLATADGARHPSIEARHDTRVRIGRTHLRFRDPSVPVEPALRDEGPVAGRLVVASVPDGPGWRQHAPLLDRTEGRAGIVAGGIALVALTSWLASYEGSTGSAVLGAVVAFLVLGSMWAGAWAVASRVAVGRFHFLGHFAVLTVVTAAAILYAEFAGWAAFLLPDSGFLALLGTVFLLALLAWWIARHLALSSKLSPRRRWTAGVTVSALLGFTVAMFAWIGMDTFTDVPVFDGTIKPLPSAWVPAMSPERFDDVVADLQADVDGHMEGGEDL